MKPTSLYYTVFTKLKMVVAVVTMELTNLFSAASLHSHALEITHTNKHCDTQLTTTTTTANTTLSADGRAK